MKGEVSKSGHLKVERAGSLTDQYCPHQSNSERCGDWCPMFGEPAYLVTRGAQLTICNRMFYFKKFIDRRMDR